MSWLKKIIKPIPFKLKKFPYSETGEGKFLSGRYSRLREFYLVVKISIEFIKGFRAFHFLGPGVTFFGSARFSEDHPLYDLTRQTAQLFSKAGYVIITGGGPGLMEAANRGAFEIGGPTVGANIRLPMEQKPNPYLNKFVTFKYFFVRKVILVKYSMAFLVMPGGYGTMDEFFEALTLIQTAKLYKFPVILMGKSYWQPLVDWLQNTMVTNGTISQDDLNYFTLTDDPSEALDKVVETTSVLGVTPQALLNFRLSQR
ncbi:MAG: TIGR00730 family Rossman fold protein [Deltaproteobacteria bacterium]